MMPREGEALLYSAITGNGPGWDLRVMALAKPRDGPGFGLARLPWLAACRKCAISAILACLNFSSIGHHPCAKASAHGIGSPGHGLIQIDILQQQNCQSRVQGYHIKHGLTAAAMEDFA